MVHPTFARIDLAVLKANYRAVRAFVAPEAAASGPIAAVREGDTIAFDIDARTLDLEVDEAEIARRLEEWTAPPPRWERGVFAKYARSVSSASEGAITG